MSPSTEPRPLRRLFRYLSARKRQVWLATTASVVNKILDLAPPALIGMAIDVVVEGEESLLARLGVQDVGHQLIVLSLLTLIIWAGESIFEYIYAVAWRNLAQDVQHDLRMDAFEQVAKLDQEWLDEHATGSLMALLNDDVNQLERFLDGGANDLLQVGTTVLVVGATFFTLSPSLTAVAFLPVPIILIGSFSFQRRIQPRYRVVRERVADLSRRLANALGGMSTLRAYGGETRAYEHLAEASVAYQDANRHAIRLSSAFSPLIRMAIVIGFTATLVWGGHMVLDGVLEVGAYSLLVFLTQRLLWPLTRLGQTFDLFQRAMASTTRIFNLIDAEPKLRGGTYGADTEKRATRFHLKDVHFQYRPDQPVLKGISVEIPEGKTTAFVGPTGAGKSTLLKLLLHDYAPTAGELYANDQSLEAWDLQALRASIGLVSQDPFLLDDTIEANLRLGKPDATDEELHQALRAAEADAFVLALPGGLKSEVGERGQRLSGGQRQRIALARALVRDPDILILDEATSAVDNETEASIQKALVRERRGKTTVVIAHRLSTIRHADAIHVLAEGQIAQSGRHEQLMTQEGLYRELWAIQTGDSAAPEAPAMNTI